MSNSLFTIAPYRTRWGSWVFDDEKRGIIGEPLIAGIDDMLDAVSAALPGKPDALSIVFSTVPFPGFDLRLNWVCEDERQVGNIYHCPELGIEGWLCPALFKYFDSAPKTLFAQFKPITKETNE